MLNFEKEQKVAKIGNISVGGQPGENPVVMIATVFYTNHAALLDEKTGKIDKKLVEQELNEYSEIVEETGMQGIIDVVGGYPEALLKQCEFIADVVDYPFLVDGLNDSSRIPAMEGLKDIGLLDRAILNSIDEATSEESLQKLKEIGVKSAVLLTFGNKYIFPQKKIDLVNYWLEQKEKGKYKSPEPPKQSLNPKSTQVWNEIEKGGRLCFSSKFSGAFNLKINNNLYKEWQSIIFPKKQKKTFM